MITIIGIYENSNVFFLKQLHESRSIRNRLIECFERASNPSTLLSKEERKRLLTFIVVGGGKIYNIYIIYTIVIYILYLHYNSTYHSYIYLIEVLIIYMHFILLHIVYMI